MSGAVRPFVSLVLVLMAAATAFAQTADPSTTGRFEVSAAAGWWGGYDLGVASTARFDADASIEGGPAVTGRFGWRVWRTLTIEGGTTFTRASLQATLQSDVDPALNGSQDTPFHQLAAELGVRAPLRRAAMRDGRLVPFLTGGGGYLRQTYEDGVLLETGRLVYAGGGVRLAPALAHADRFFKHLGLRVDARAVVRTGGIDTEETPRLCLTLMAGVFVTF
jgi:opacity protein-like surface antigen